MSTTYVHNDYCVRPGNILLVQNLVHPYNIPLCAHLLPVDVLFQLQGHNIHYNTFFHNPSTSYAHIQLLYEKCSFHQVHMQKCKNMHYLLNTIANTMGIVFRPSILTRNPYLWKIPCLPYPYLLQPFPRRTSTE